MGIRDRWRRFVEAGRQGESGSLAEQLHEWSRQAAVAAQPERVADPGAEIDRMYQIIEGYLAAGRTTYPGPSEALSTLLATYKAQYGIETILTSRRAAELSAAILDLVQRMSAVPLPPPAVDDDGYGHLIIAVGHVHRLANYVLDRVREPGR